MSDIQKTIEHFKLIKPDYPSDIFDITIAALEKQVPVKVDHNTDYDFFTCSNCGIDITNTDYKYCPECGRQFGEIEDWSDSNE